MTLPGLAVAALLISTQLPFYARGAVGPAAPRWGHFWATGDWGHRLGVVFQVIGLVAGVAAGVFAGLWPGRRAWRLAAVGLVTVGLAATWVLAAERAMVLGTGRQGLARSLGGMGFGAAVYVAAGVLVAILVFLASVQAGSRSPLRGLAAAVLWVAVTAGVGLGSAAAWQLLRPGRIALGFSIVPAHDLYGRELTGGVVARVVLSNRGSRPIVVRRAGSENLGGGQDCRYCLRVKTMRQDGSWAEVRRLAWTGIWPELDFRTTRSLDPGASWELEAVLSGPGGESGEDSRPRGVAVQVLDHQGVVWRQRWALLPTRSSGKRRDDER